MNNFKLTGDGYISKDGSDGNSGLTTDLPKQTFQIVAYPKNIVGSGVYKGIFNVTAASVLQFEADGNVVIECSGDFTQTATDSLDTARYVGMQFYMNSNNFITDVSTNSFSYCTLKDGALQRSDVNDSTVSMNYSIFENMTDGGGTGDLNLIFANTIVLSSFVPALSISNSYISSDTTIIGLPTTMVYSDIQGRFDIEGVYYELKRDKNGVFVNPNPSYLDVFEIAPNIYNNGNFNQDPEFNDVGGDYRSVDLTSPLLLADTLGLNNLGGTYYAPTVVATDTEFSTGTVTNLTIASSSYVITAGATGDVITIPIQIAPIPQIIGNLEVVSSKNFNSLEVKPSAENNNVTIVNNYAKATAGANPRRLTYEMRWSTKNTIPTVTADWDNNSRITAGNYVKFEHDTTPLIDDGGLGNGEPTFNLATNYIVHAKWVQVKITLNEYIG